MQTSGVNNPTRVAHPVSYKIARKAAFIQKGRSVAKSVQLRAESEDKTEGGDDEIWKLPLAGSDTDWRAFRARLVAGESAEPSSQAQAIDAEREESWAHSIAQPERGCLVLAHPLMFQQHQQYFHQAVILLINHDESGTAGLILNKPLDQQIENLQGAESLRPEFDKNTLFLGGDVGGPAGGNVLQLLHNQKQFAKSIEVVDGVYMGGHEAARMAVRKDELDPVTTCRWYCRYAGWAPGQLQSEIKQGVWFPIAASKDLILHPSSQSDSRIHWHSVMQKIGGEHKQLSEAMQDQERLLLADLQKVDPDVNHLQRMVEAEKEREQDKDPGDEQPT